MEVDGSDDFPDFNFRWFLGEPAVIVFQASASASSRQAKLRGVGAVELSMKHTKTQQGT